MRAATLLAVLCLAAAVSAEDAGKQIETIETRLSALDKQKAALRKQLGKLRAELRAEAEKQIDPHLPQFHIPRLPKAPTIDGAMTPGEWDRAIAVTTGAGIRGAGLRLRPSAVF